MAPAVRARLEKAFADAAATAEFKSAWTPSRCRRVVPGAAFEEMLGRELLRYRKAAIDYGIRQ